MSKKDKTSSQSPQRYCPGCGAAVAASDRFCRECGAPLAADAKPRARLRLTGLQAFGLAVIALAIVYALLLLTGDRGRQPPVQPIPITDVGAGRAPSQPLTERGAADQLFNRAMTAYETGDSAAARQFVPMAITAYQALDSLELDARYHLALLSLAANRPRDALAQTDTMLAEDPNHLLALSAAARAHDALGRPDQAAEYYRRFVEAYTPEVAAARPEYLDHRRALPARLEEARRYLQERGLGPGDS
jgi:tetratricopeptide (TPR) repeat protein